MEELSTVSLVRGSEGLFKDQLAHWHARNQFDPEWSVVADFKLDRIHKPRMDSRRSRVDADSES